MSGIYIKGMEMPISCHQCWIPCDVPFQDRYYLSRAKNCPATPIPPHGDLIGRDELIENCMKEDSFLAELLFRKVSNAPVIIPAEEVDTHDNC